MKFSFKLFCRSTARRLLSSLRRLLCAAATIAALSGCFFNRDEVPAYPIPAGMQLVWSDEFDYEGAPDPTKWSYSLGASGWGNEELQRYTDSRANSWVKGGKLFIAAKSDGASWTSARLNTRKTASWTCGYFEIRARLAVGQGIQSALWMLPHNDIYGRWPRSGEIVIAENAGAGTIYQAAYTEASSGEDSALQGSASRVKDAAGEFHSYAVEWTQEFIRWLVDGRETLFLKNDGSGSEAWPFDIPFYIIVSVAAGGGIKEEDSSIKSAVMEVDYVRVYQKAEAKAEE